MMESGAGTFNFKIYQPPTQGLHIQSHFSCVDVGKPIYPPYKIYPSSNFIITKIIKNTINESPNGFVMFLIISIGIICGPVFNLSWFKKACMHDFIYERSGWQDSNPHLLFPKQTC